MVKQNHNIDVNEQEKEEDSDFPTLISELGYIDIYVKNKKQIKDNCPFQLYINYNADGYVYGPFICVK